MLSDILADVIPSASPSILETAFAVARSSKDERLLVALAGRPDLPPEMEEFVASSPSVKVQRARFSRPGMSPDTIKAALKKERRAGVLSAIAQTQGLPDEIYETLSTSSFRAVASAVLANDSASRLARTKAATALASRFESLPYATRGVLSRSLEDDKVEARLVFDSADETLQAHMAKHADKLSQEQQMLLANRVLDRARAASADKSLSGFSSYKRFALLRELMHVGCTLLEATDHDSVVSVLSEAEPLVGDSTLTAMLASRADGLSARRDRMNLALSSNDTAELLSLVSDVVANKDTKLARILAENTALPIDAAAQVLAVLSQQDAVAAVEKRNCATTAGRIVPGLSLDSLMRIARKFGSDIVRYLPQSRVWGAEVLRAPEFEQYARDFVLACSLVRIREVLSPNYGSCPPAIMAALTDVLASLPSQSAEVVLNLSSDWSGTLGDLVSLGVVLDDQR